MNNINSPVLPLNTVLPVTQTAEEFKRLILEGQMDPLSAYINLGRIEKIIEAVKKDRQITMLALDEFSKHGQKSKQFGDCTAEQSEAGVKYDYSECGDSILQELLVRRHELESAIKERETMLKNLPGMMVITDPDTGETFEVRPPSRSSKTVLKLTFKK